MPAQFMLVCFVRGVRFVRLDVLSVCVVCLSVCVLVNFFVRTFVCTIVCVMINTHVVYVCLTSFVCLCVFCLCVCLCALFLSV